VYFYVHAAAATRGECLAVSKAWWCCCDQELVAASRAKHRSSLSPLRHTAAGLTSTGSAVDTRSHVIAYHLLRRPSS